MLLSVAFAKIFEIALVERLHRDQPEGHRYQLVPRLHREIGIRQIGQRGPVTGRSSSDLLKYFRGFGVLLRVE